VIAVFNIDCPDVIMRRDDTREHRVVLGDDTALGMTVGGRVEVQTSNQGHGAQNTVTRDTVTPCEYTRAYVTT